MSFVVAGGAAAGCILVTVALDNSAAEEASFRKWPLPVLCAVGEQPARYSEIRDQLPGITDRALAGALKQLQSGVLAHSLSRG